MPNTSGWFCSSYLMLLQVTTIGNRSIVIKFGERRCQTSPRNIMFSLFMHTNGTSYVCIMCSNDEQNEEHRRSQGKELSIGTGTAGTCLLVVLPTGRYPVPGL